MSQHPSAIIPRKLWSHRTQTLHTARCVQPAVPDCVGNKHPLFCECHFLYLHFPLCTHTAPYTLLINTLVRNHPRSSCSHTWGSSCWLLQPMLSVHSESRLQAASDGDDDLSSIGGCCTGTNSGNTKSCLTAVDTKISSQLEVCVLF